MKQTQFRHFTRSIVILALMATGVATTAPRVQAIGIGDEHGRYGGRSTVKEWIRESAPRGYRWGDHGHEGAAFQYGIYPRLPGDRRAGGTHRSMFRPGAFGRTDEAYIHYRNRPETLGWLPGWLHR